MDDIFTHQTFFIHIKVMKYFLTPKSLFKSLNLFQLCSKFVVFISTSPSPQNFPYSGSGHQTNCGHLFSWPKRILNSVALKPSIVNWPIEVAGSNISPSFSHATKQQIQLQIQIQHKSQNYFKNRKNFPISNFPISLLLSPG